MLLLTHFVCKLVQSTEVSPEHCTVANPFKLWFIFTFTNINPALYLVPQLKRIKTGIWCLRVNLLDTIIFSWVYHKLSVHMWSACWHHKSSLHSIHMSTNLLKHFFFWTSFEVALIWSIIMQFSVCTHCSISKDVSKHKPLHTFIQIWPNSTLWIFTWRYFQINFWDLFSVQYKYILCMYRSTITVKFSK